MMAAGVIDLEVRPSCPMAADIGGRLIAGAAGACVGPYDADIIILARGRPDETVAAIGSARAQTGVSTHVFVLDQGSSVEVLERLAAAVHPHRNVTLLAAERNLGVAGGRNLVSSLGHGRVIVALDNDAEFATPDTAARLVAGLDAEPRLAAIGCRIVTHGDGVDDVCSWGYAARLLPCAGESFDSVTYVGAGHAIRRSAWAQAGGYDPKLFFCWEEYDFCLRAIALGWRVRYRGDIVVRHKVTADQRVGWTAARWFYFVRNRLYIERKLGRNWVGLTPRVAGYVLKGLRNGLPMQTLRAVVAAAGMTPDQLLPRMPAAGVFYLQRNDTAQRGSFLRHGFSAVLGRLGRPPGAVSGAER